MIQKQILYFIIYNNIFMWPHNTYIHTYYIHTTYSCFTYTSHTHTYIQIQTNLHTCMYTCAHVCNCNDVYININIIFIYMNILYINNIRRYNVSDVILLHFYTVFIILSFCSSTGVQCHRNTHNQKLVLHRL